MTPTTLQNVLAFARLLVAARPATPITTCTTLCNRLTWKTPNKARSVCVSEPPREGMNPSTPAAR